MSELQQFIDDAKRLSTMFGAVANLGAVAEKLARAESAAVAAEDRAKEAEAKRVAAVAAADQAWLDFNTKVDKTKADLAAENAGAKEATQVECDLLVAESEGKLAILRDDIAVAQASLSEVEGIVRVRQQELKEIEQAVKDAEVSRDTIKKDIAALRAKLEG